MLKNNLVLILILALAAFLRFYQLGQNPPAPDWDETGHGYNAYSFLKTGGHDEYGYFLPLSIRSFDDYKPPLYTYLVIPCVAVFGLTDFAVRFPSAFLGVLAVLFTYLMVYELFKNKKIALLAALFLAISPWHLQFSRVAFETNSATFWSVLATWAFLKGVSSQRKRIIVYMSLASLAFGANLFMYHNARVFTPVYSLVLIFLYRKFLWKNKKYLVLPLIISAIFVLTLLPVIFSIAGQQRYEGTTVFSDQSPKFKASQLILEDQQSGFGLLGSLLHNRRFVYIPVVIENYLSHFRPNFLFLQADMERHHAPMVGLLYLWDIPFILAGIFFLASKKLNLNSKIIVFVWFLLAPLAASVTWGVPHSLRSEIYLPTYQIFIALGFYFIYQNTKRKKTFLSIAALILVANFLFYLHQYYVHMPLEYSKYWLYGRKQAVQYTEANKNKYDKVIVSTKLEQPHEFWLYYSKYDPVKYLKEGGTVSGGFLEDRNKFDKYQFKPIDFAKQNNGKTLFVTTPEDFPSGAKILEKIFYLNGEPAIYIGDAK